MTTINQQELNEAVQVELSKMLHDEPVRMVSTLLVVICRMLVEANSETTTMSHENDWNGFRYKVEAKINIKKLHKL